jgi:hypothetical protein
MNRLTLSLAIGAAALLSASAVNAAPAQRQAQAPIASDAIAKDTDMSSHRRHWRRWHGHHHHWGHHRWRPHYWGHHHWAPSYRSYGYYRPARVVRYYRPAPIYYPYSYYRPAPVFSIGFGFGPRFWW